MSENTASAKAEDSRPVSEKKGKQEGSDPSFNLDKLQALAGLMDEHGFTEFEFENEDIRVRLSKTAGTQAVQAAAPVAAPAPQAAPPTTAEAAPAADPDAGLHKIVSPIVGTFYRSPGPDKDSYVSEGSNVSPETTVCIVEAMKLMNEIQAEVSGEIVKIYVENGQPVEYGQALFGVKK
jgi:acetyl-CoA carboxylase biotin carboxyl carrier protein